MSRLRTTLESKPPLVGAVFENKGIGDKAIEDLKTHVAPVAIAMQQVQNASPLVAAGVKNHASTVRGSAKSVDDAAAGAHQALNWEFKQAYEAIAKLPTLG
jgi:hypothetical protein